MMSTSNTQQGGTAVQSSLVKPNKTAECNKCKAAGFPAQPIGFLNDATRPSGWRVVNPDGTDHAHQGSAANSKPFGSTYANKPYYVIEDERSIVEIVPLSGVVNFTSTTVKQLLAEGWKPVGSTTGEDFRQYNFNEKGVMYITYKLVKRKKIDFQ